MTKITKIKFALLGATALLAATSAHAQVADTWDITGDVNVTATNNTADGVSLDGTNGNFVDGANIQDGYKNSISGAAVGASASQSFTALNASAAGSIALGQYDANIALAAGNSTAVLNTNSLTSTPTIVAGQGNSISLAAVGASASGGGTMSGLNGTADNAFSLTIGGTTTVQTGAGTADSAGGSVADGVGGNDGDIGVRLDAGVDNPVISTGNANSISVAAVGSSSSFGLTFNNDAGSTNATASSLGDLLTVTSSNTGGISVSSDGTDAGDNAVINTALISAGTNNSISAATVGSSGSVSVSDNIYGSAGGTTGTVDFSDITVSTLNEGTITNKTQLDDGPTIEAGTLNSISVAGVGTSASVGFSVTDYSGDGTGVSATALSTGQIDIAATNVGGVLVSTGMATPTISGGFQNSISAAAVGASASQSISHTVLPPIG